MMDHERQSEAFIVMLLLTSSGIRFSKYLCLVGVLYARAPQHLLLKRLEGRNTLESSSVKHQILLPRTKCNILL